MPNKPVPKYRHYKPKNLAVVRIHGTDHYLGKYQSPESYEKYSRLLAAMNEGQEAAAEPTPASPLLVKELVDRFWTHAETYYRRADGTPTGDLHNWRHAFRPLTRLFASTPAADFGPKSLKLVRAAMIKAGVSRRVINRRVQRIVALFGWGVEEELLPPSTHHALKAVKSLRKGRTRAPELPKVRPVDDALVDGTLPFLTRQLRAVAELQRLSAARSGEILVMRSGDVDRTGPVWDYSPAWHKGEFIDKERHIFFGPQAQAIVRQWLRPDPDEYLFQPGEAREEWLAARRAKRRSPMTPSQAKRKRKRKPRHVPTPGAPYDPRAYAHAVKRACLTAFPHPHVAEVQARRKGLRRAERQALDAELAAWREANAAELKAWEKAHHWHPHQLRHTAATRLRRQHGIEVAQIVCGHESPNVTAIYAEADTELAKEIMGKAG